MQAAHVVPLRPHNAPIQLSDYHAEWPALFIREAARVRATLGARVLMLEHENARAKRRANARGLADEERRPFGVVVAQLDGSVMRAQRNNMRRLHLFFGNHVAP